MGGVFTPLGGTVGGGVPCGGACGGSGAFCPGTPAFPAPGLLAESTGAVPAFVSAGLFVSGLADGFAFAELSGGVATLCDWIGADSPDELLSPVDEPEP